MAKVILKGHIMVCDAEMTLIEAALPIHIELTQAEAGCLVFSVTKSDIKGRFDVYEEFIDEAAFELHQARVKNSNWGLISQNVERHYEIAFNEE